MKTETREVARFTLFAKDGEPYTIRRMQPMQAMSSSTSNGEHWVADGAATLKTLNDDPVSETDVPEVMEIDFGFKKIRIAPKGFFDANPFVQP